MHAKFEVSSSNLSRDMEGSQNFKSRSRDPSRSVSRGSAVTPYLESSTPICLSLYNFHGATVTIKGSLLSRIPIVTAFLSRFFVQNLAGAKSENRSKIGDFAPTRSL